MLGPLLVQRVGSAIPQRIPGIQSGSNLFEFVVIENQQNVEEAWRAQKQAITEVHASILRIAPGKLESTEVAGIEEFSCQVLLGALDLVRARCATRLSCYPCPGQNDILSACRQLARMIPRSCFIVDNQECHARQFLAGICSFLEPRSLSLHESIETAAEDTQPARWSSGEGPIKRHKSSSHPESKRSISPITIELESEVVMEAQAAQQEPDRRPMLPQQGDGGLQSSTPPTHYHNRMASRSDEFLSPGIESSPGYLSPTPAPRRAKRRRSAHDQVIADLQEKIKEKDRIIKESEKRVQFLRKFISVRTGMNEADLLLSEKRVLVMGQTYKLAWMTASGSRNVAGDTRAR